MTRPLPKSLRRLMALHPDKLHEGHSEQDAFGDRPNAWNHWLYLKPGWCYPEPGSHIIHECTVREVRQAFAAVQPCDCDDCIIEKARESGDAGGKA